MRKDLEPCANRKDSNQPGSHTVKLQWLKNFLDFENFFETGAVRASEG